MNSKYKLRELNDFCIQDLPEKIGLSQGKHTLDVSTIRIKESGPKTTTYDFGCIAYRKRRSSRSSTDGRQSYVDMEVVISSVCKKRKVALCAILEGVHTQLRIGQYKDSTLCLRLYCFIRFAKWCDENSYPDFLNSLDQAKQAVKGYNDAGLILVKTGKGSSKTIANTTSSVIELLKLVFGVSKDNLVEGIHLIRRRPPIPTALPSEDTVSEVLALYYHLFAGIYDLIINEQKYPYELRLPKETVWIFPAGRWCSTAECLEHKKNGAYANEIVDYENGRYREYEEVIKLFPEFKRDRYDVTKIIEEYEHANIDLKHFRRKRLAFFGCKVFLMMFLANTGMNLTVAGSLEWDDSNQVGKGLHGFKTIKCRAGDREVEYQITATFLKYFHKYLSLRRYVLQSGDFDGLFFHIGHGQKAKRINSHTPSTLKQTCIELFYKDLDYMCTRELRAYRSDYSVKKYGVTATAILLQNTEATVLKHYAEGSENESKEQMVRFYKDYEEIICRKNVQLTEIPAGKCKDVGNPKTSKNNDGIIPDCSQPEGCLSCENYAVHIDYTSVSKLLSLRYVICETKVMSNNSNHFESVFGDTLSDIDSIISAIESKSKKAKKIVDKVKRDIENEDLNLYWEHKLAMLVEIGALE